jgi:hypothetical protein
MPLLWSNGLGTKCAHAKRFLIEPMSWLSSILRVLAPIAVEHGGQVLRDSFKSRTAQGQAPPAGPDPLQLLATDVDQLKAYSLELKAEIETLNIAIAAREERLRKWLLALLIWNAMMTLGVIVLAVVALRH